MTLFLIDLVNDLKETETYLIVELFVLRVTGRWVRSYPTETKARSVLTNTATDQVSRLLIVRKRKKGRNDNFI